MAEPAIRKKVEEDIMSRVDMTSDAPPIPKKMGIEINNHCNHACYFCANTIMTRAGGNMDDALVHKVLAEGREAGITEVGFYATGDPYLNPKVNDYIAEAKALGYGYIYLSSNGNAAKVERMMESIERGLDSLKFSINAGDRESYKAVHQRDHFEKVIANLRAISAWRRETGRKFRFFVTSVQNPRAPGAFEKLRALIGSEVDEIVPVALTSIGTQVSEQLLAEVDPDDPLNQVRAVTPCKLLWRMVNVQKEGFLSACCSDFQNDLLVADLRTTRLVDAWKSAAFREIRRRHIEDRIEGTLCELCVKQRILPYAALSPSA